MKTLIILAIISIATAALAKPPIAELAACFSSEEEASDFADRCMLHSHGNNVRCIDGKPKCCKDTPDGRQGCLRDPNSVFPDRQAPGGTKRN